jgi:hypothetical protein
VAGRDYWRENSVEEQHMHVFIWASLVLIGAVGFLGLVSPHWFTLVAGRTSHWVDTSKILSFLDKEYDIDRYVLPHCRVFGATVLAAVAMIAMIIVRY